MVLLESSQCSPIFYNYYKLLVPKLPVLKKSFASIFSSPAVFGLMALKIPYISNNMFLTPTQSHHSDCHQSPGIPKHFDGSTVGWNLVGLGLPGWSLAGTVPNWAGDRNNLGWVSLIQKIRCHKWERLLTHQQQNAVYLRFPQELQ